MPAQSFKRSVRELNPISFLTKELCRRNTYRPVISSDPGWNRTNIETFSVSRPAFRRPRSNASFRDTCRPSKVRPGKSALRESNASPHATESQCTQRVTKVSTLPGVFQEYFSVAGGRCLAIPDARLVCIAERWLELPEAVREQVEALCLQPAS